ncbi:MAG: formaldehyde-activating enzyme [Acidobacteria bacterium]|nr:formaldehyde-activating enzyme [Acidobacteriota bacterium]
MEIGEGFAGTGAEAAHINTVLGARSGPVGTAFATALGSPTTGHIPFLVVWEPNIPVTPATLFINKAAIASDRHGELTWGAAQAGVALGVTRYAAERFATPGAADGFVLMCAVWVDPAAADEQLVLDNNATATHDALLRGAFAPQPNDAVEALRAGHRPTNPYLRHSP